MSKTKTTLAEKCKKIQVTIKTYSGIKADTEAKRELADNKNADETLVNVSKHLFDRTFLREPTKIGKQFRNNVIYKRTLPWIDADDRVLGEGTSYVAGTHRRVKGGEWRLLPADQLNWFEQQVKEYRKRFFDAVDEIITGYEDAIEEAEQQHTGLGDLFNRLDYPSVDDLRARYIFEYEIGIINEFNSRDIRVQIDEEVRENIVATELAKEKSIKQNADSHTAKKLVGLVENLADRLDAFDPKNPSKNPLRDSSFDNLRDLLDVVDNYLLTDDDNLQKTIDDLRKDIVKSKISQSDLKKDGKTRKATVKKLRKAEKEIKISDTAKGLF